MGSHVDLSHVAATSMGMRVTAQVELIAVEDRRLRFKLDATREGAAASAAGSRQRNRRVGWIFAIVTWW